MTAAQIAADELLAFQDFPTERAYIGVGTYSCLVGQYARGNNLVEGGLAPEYDLELMVERSALPAEPVKSYIYEGQRVVFRNYLFSVSHVREDDAQSYLTVSCKFAGARQPVNPLLTESGDWIISADGQPLEG